MLDKVVCACTSYRPFIPKPSCTFCGGSGEVLEGTRGWFDAKELGWPGVLQ